MGTRDERRAVRIAALTLVIGPLAGSGWAATEPSCARWALEGLSPGMTAEEVLAKRPTEGVRSLIRDPDRLETSGVEYPGPPFDVYVEYDGRIDRRPPPRAVRVRLSLPPSPTAEGETLERFGPPRVGAVELENGLRDGIAVWIDEACGVVLTAHRPLADWWLPPPGLVLQLQPLGFVRRGMTSANVELNATLELARAPEAPAIEEPPPPIDVPPHPETPPAIERIIEEPPPLVDVPPPPTTPPVIEEIIEEPPQLVEAVPPPETPPVIEEIIEEPPQLVEAMPPPETPPVIEEINEEPPRLVEAVPPPVTPPVIEEIIEEPPRLVEAVPPPVTPPVIEKVVEKPPVSAVPAKPVTIATWRPTTQVPAPFAPSPEPPATLATWLRPTPANPPPPAAPATIATWNPAAASPPKPSTDRAAEPLTSVPPVYPTTAKWLGLKGEVTLRLIVTADGSVANPPRVLTARPMGRGFEEAAVEAVRQWRYAPAIVGGRPVESELTVRVAFE